MNAVPARTDEPRVALVTYSTKPRGGVVHTLSLADAMADRAMQVRVVALGNADQDFFRPVRAPYSLVPTSPPADTLEKRVFASIDDLEAGLSKIADEVDIFHTQDCISARAAARVRDAGARVRVVRTVHHVDDFTTAALIDCQRKAIEEPDQLVVVSEDWRNRLKADYGVDAVVIHNGVDADRFAPIDPARRAALRQRAGVADRFVFLSVGGIEPRKGSVFLVQAMAILARGSIPRPSSWWSADTRSRTTPATATKCSRHCPASASSWVATSSWPARSAMPSFTSGTEAQTRSSSRRSRRGGAWPSSRPWRPTFRWCPATSPCCVST